MAPGYTGSGLWRGPSSHWSSLAPFSLRQMSTRMRCSQVGFGNQLRGKRRHHSGMPCPHGLSIRTGRQDMDIVSDWDWGTVAPPQAWGHPPLPSLRPHRGQEALALVPGGENPQPQAQISAPSKNPGGRRNGNCLPLPSKFKVPSRVKQDGQCFLMILGRYLGSGKTQASDTESCPQLTCPSGSSKGRLSPASD